nr:MAG TPA: hypothetical protein [Caudoviricetes sp.]
MLYWCLFGCLYVCKYRSYMYFDRHPVYTHINGLSITIWSYRISCRL